MTPIQYYIISAADAKRLGVAEYRQGNAEQGYLVHSGDFICATDDFLERAQPVSESEAREFIKTLKK